jgi:hypothetical protein
VLIQKVNLNDALQGELHSGTPAGTAAPVMATPAIFATPVIAKTAGYVVGGAVVTGAATVAYKTATG